MCIKKYLINQNGGALVAVIGIILIASMLCITALMSCLANIKSEVLHCEWTKGYYELDGQMERLLAYCDEKTVQNAESFACTYLKNEIFKTDELPNDVFSDNVFYDEPYFFDKLHDFIRKKWCYIETETEFPELTDFLKEAYEILFFFYIDRIAIMLENGDKEDVFLDKFEKSEKYSYTVEMYKFSKTEVPRYSDIVFLPLNGWDDFLIKNSIDDQPVYVIVLTVRKTPSDNEKTRQLRAEILLGLSKRNKVSAWQELWTDDE